VSPGTTPGTANERLAQDVLEPAVDDPLTAELVGWLDRSPRFRAFATANRDKIHKKLRHARDGDSRLDVRAELLAARHLLADRRIDLAFEAYGSGRGGPDFTATFRSSRTFNVEVTRLRRPPDRTDYSEPILAKLRQLPPTVPNVLVIAVDGDAAGALDSGAAVRALRARADAKDEAFFTRHGFTGSRGFYDRLLRLGAVIAWAERGAGDERAALWTNGSARTALPERAAAACLAAFRADA
jgi:hypothetical protein